MGGPIKNPTSPHEIVQRINELYETGPSTVCSTAVTGEPYVTFVIGGVKPEGMPAMVLCSNKEVACQMWWSSFMEYACNLPFSGTGRPRKIYWRKLPTIENAENGMFYVRARLLISSWPETHPETDMGPWNLDGTRATFVKE